MVRDPTYRKKKYEAKMNADSVRSRIEAHRDSMIEQQAVKLSNLAELEDKVRKYLMQQGISPIEIPPYLAFARELWSKAQKYTGTTLTNEANMIRQKWIDRGLDNNKLTRIQGMIITG